MGLFHPIYLAHSNGPALAGAETPRWEIFQIHLESCRILGPKIEAARWIRFSVIHFRSEAQPLGYYEDK